jgi:hypothetical protein
METSSSVPSDESESIFEEPTLLDPVAATLPRDKITNMSFFAHLETERTRKDVQVFRIGHLYVTRIGISLFDDYVPEFLSYLFDHFIK